jgi:hypothetical protein
MKRNFLIALIILSVAACNDKPKPPAETRNNDKSNCIPFNPDKIGKQAFDQPVNKEIAERCVKAMETMYVTTPDFEQMKKSYTQSITFGSKALCEWMRDMKIYEDSKLVSLRLGVYTDEAVKEWKLDAKYLGRVTAFVWPYKDLGATETLTDPFNVGSLHP